jgi:hypothetical protein
LIFETTTSSFHHRSIQFSEFMIRDSLILLPVRQNEGMTQDQVRKMSKALFGNSHRVEIAAAVGQATTELVTAHDLALELGISDNLVGIQLKSFVLSGVMDDCPGVEGQRSRYFRRLENPYWDVAQRMVNHWRIQSKSNEQSPRFAGGPTTENRQ